MAGVTFVVPVFNKAPYLPAVLRQIERQRGDFRRQYVFVDDGSTDQSPEILAELTADWPNVEIHRQANAGSAAATNAGIARAREPFIKFVDADDLLATDATRVLLDRLQASDAVMAYGRRTYFAPAEADSLDFECSRADAPETVIQEPLRPAIRNSLCNPTQMLVRTEAAQAVGGCDERIVYSQEYSLTLRLARLGPFVRIETVVAHLLAEAGGRLSNNEARQLQRVTRAVANFLRDYPDLPADVRRFACRRAAGRAWKHIHRSEGARGLFHPAYWRQFAWLRGIDDAPAFVERCAESFETASRDVAGAPVRETGLGRG